MHAKYICKPNIVKFLENNNDKSVEFSPARILIKTRIIKLSFSIKKYAIPIIRPRFLEVRYSRTKQFFYLSEDLEQRFHKSFESNRAASRCAQRRYNPESLCLWKIKSILVAILNSTLASENKGNSAIPVAYRGNRFETMPTILIPPFVSMYCTSNILGISRALMNSVGATERAASTANIPSEMKAPVSFRRPS